MIFTVIQYFPLLEEETPGHKIELAKKMQQNDSMGGDGEQADDDCDSDDDAARDLNLSYTATYSTPSSNNNSKFARGNTLYKYQLGNIHTPPPKI